MSFRILPFLLVVLSLTSCHLLKANPIDSRVVQVSRVSDGDSFTLASGEKIRLCGIDAPETKQPLGKESKANLQRLIDQAQGRVIVWGIERDRYGRTVAEVFIAAPTKAQPEQEISLNAAQLQSGMAYVYQQYVGSCPNRGVMASVEQQAQQQRIGVWAGNDQKPWNYRNSQR